MKDLLVQSANDQRSSAANQTHAISTLSLASSTLRLRQAWQNIGIVGYVRTKAWFEAHPSAVLILLGLLILADGTMETAHAYDKGKKFKGMCKSMVELAEGPFGAMLTAVAGIGAIIASAMGGFKMAWACLIVAVGGFILRAYIGVFFSDCTQG